MGSFNLKARFTFCQLLLGMAFQCKTRRGRRWHEDWKPVDDVYWHCVIQINHRLFRRGDNRGNLAYARSIWSMTEWTYCARMWWNVSLMWAYAKAALSSLSALIRRNSNLPRRHQLHFSVSECFCPPETALLSETTTESETVCTTTTTTTTITLSYSLVLRVSPRRAESAN